MKQATTICILIVLAVFGAAVSSASARNGSPRNDNNDGIGANGTGESASGASGTTSGTSGTASGSSGTTSGSATGTGGKSGSGGW